MATHRGWHPNANGRSTEYKAAGPPKYGGYNSPSVPWFIRFCPQRSRTNRFADRMSFSNLKIIQHCMHPRFVITRPPKATKRINRLFSAGLFRVLQPVPVRLFCLTFPREMSANVLPDFAAKKPCRRNSAAGATCISERDHRDRVRSGRLYIDERTECHERRRRSRRVNSDPA